MSYELPADRSTESRSATRMSSVQIPDADYTVQEEPLLTVGTLRALLDNHPDDCPIGLCLPGEVTVFTRSSRSIFPIIRKYDGRSRRREYCLTIDNPSRPPTPHEPRHFRVFKVFLVGGQKTGKTRFYNSLQHSRPVEESTEYVPTTEGHCYMFARHDDGVIINLFDTPGDPKYRSMVSSRPHGAEGAMIFVEDEESEDEYRRWVADVKEVSPNCITVAATYETAQISLDTLVKWMCERL